MALRLTAFVALAMVALAQPDPNADATVPADADAPYVAVSKHVLNLPTVR